MTDDFSDAPKSITEIKADRAFDGRLWTPRDALIAALRDVDNQVFTPAIAFLTFGEVTGPNRDTNTRYYAAGGNHYEVMGMAYRAIWQYENE